MSILARHEIVRELAGTALVQVSRVKTPSKPDGSLVLKRCRLLQDGFSDRRSAVTSFLDSARVQQSAAKAPDSHWAPVHELVEDADGGHYVTDFYPSSAQRLINGQVRLSGQALYAVAKSVLKGLLALRKAADRSHGNLKPTNVLIAGSDEIEEGDVFLSDPADSANPNAHDGGADDLFQFGQLIHQLVLHQPFRPVVGWPIEPSPAWSRLGYAGRRWREFCNHLLDPNALARPSTPEEALAELERVRRRPVWHWVAAGAVAAVIVAAVGFGLVNHSRHKQIRQDAQALQTEYEDWFRSFQDVVDLPPDVTRGDEYIAMNVVAPIKAARASNLLHPARVEDLYTTPPSPFEGARAGELREVLGLIRRTEAAMAKWETRAWLEDRHRAYHERGWTDIAAYFGGLAEGVKPRSKAAPTHLDHVLSNRADLRKLAAAVDGTWSAVEQRLREITGRADGAMTPIWFEQYVREEAESFAGEMKVPSDIAHRLQHLTKLQKEADKFAELVPQRWADGVDLVSLKADEAADEKNGVKRTWEYFWAWGRRLDRYKLEPVPAVVVDDYARTLERFAGSLRELRDLSKTPGTTLAGYESRLAELGKQVEGLRSQPLTKKDAEGRQKALDLLVRQYGTELAEALRQVSPADPAEKWAKDVRGQFDTAEKPVKAAWVRLLSQRVPASPALLDGQRAVYARLRDEVAALATALGAVSNRFPPPPKLGDAFDPVVEATRLSFLERATNLVGVPGGPALQEAKLGELGKEYEQWLHGMSQLAAHWQAARELLDSGAEIDADGPTGLPLSELEDVVRQGLDEQKVPEAAAGRIMAVFAPLGKLREDARNAAALRDEAEAMKTQGDLPAALKSYQEVVRLKPKDVVAAAQVKELEAAIEQRTRALAAEAAKELAAKNFDAAAEAIRKLAAWSSPQRVGELERALKNARADATRQAVQPVIAKASTLAYEQYNPQAALEVLAGQNQPEVNQLRKTIQDLVNSAERNASAADQLVERRQYALAADYYDAAARGGSARAMFRLGVMARDGVGMRPAEDKARRWFELAEKNNYDGARAALDAMENARRAAVELNEQLQKANAGDLATQVTVARKFDEQGDWARAKRYYGLASAQGDTPSTVRLAWMHWKGLGGPQNIRKARELYTEAAKKQNREAKEWLANNPDRVPKPVRRIGDATIH